MPLFGHLIVYTPPGEDFFCVEPVSHMTDAINRMDGDDRHRLAHAGIQARHCKARSHSALQPLAEKPN